MFKIGNYEIEYPAYNISPDEISLTLDWEGNVEELAQLFLNNNCIFELNNIIYTEYNIIFSIAKYFNVDNGQYLIILRSSKNPQDNLTTILGKEMPYSEIVECRKNLEDCVKYFPIEKLVSMSWAIENYSNNKIYKFDDIVIYSGEIYKCIKELTFKGEFNPSDWLHLENNEWVEYIEPEEE